VGVIYDALAFRRAAQAFAAIQSPSHSAAILVLSSMLESAVDEAERQRGDSQMNVAVFPAVVCPSCAQFAQVTG
jgi:hypothetical protein